MAQFTVRVELHDADWTHYETLHTAMQQQGFSRLITADDGRVYHMPWAEYDGIGTFTSMQVLGFAQQAVARTGKKHAILVTESVNRVWIGLPLSNAIAPVAVRR